MKAMTPTEAVAVSPPEALSTSADGGDALTCGTCPCYVGRGPRDPGAAAVAAQYSVLRGQCHLTPTVVTKGRDDWCWQHPHRKEASA